MPRDTPDESEDGEKLQMVLDALDDPNCRTILKTLQSPMTAQELMETCDLPQTTTYRKLDLLTEADLVSENVEVRADGHHTTQYRRTFDGVLIGLSDDEQFNIELIQEPESAVERLARLWSEVGAEL